MKWFSPLCLIIDFLETDTAEQTIQEVYALAAKYKDYSNRIARDNFNINSVFKKINNNNYSELMQQL
jgi:hypothetical protein